MSAFGIGVVTGHRRYKLRFIKTDARVAEHFIDWFNCFRRHHGRGADFINLQQRRSVTGTKRGDTRAQALFIVALIHRHNLVIRIGRIETLRQRINLFPQLAFHRMPEWNGGNGHGVSHECQA